MDPAIVPELIAVAILLAVRSIRSALSWVREHWCSGSAYDSSSGFRVELFWEMSKMFPSCINEILLTAHSLEEWFLSLTPQNSFQSFKNEAEEYLTQTDLREIGDRTLNPESPITGMMAVSLGAVKDDPEILIHSCFYSPFHWVIFLKGHIWESLFSNQRILTGWNHLPVNASVIAAYGLIRFKVRALASSTTYDEFPETY